MNEPYVVIRFILKLLCGISVAWIAFVLAFHFLGSAGGWISLAGLVKVMPTDQDSRKLPPL